MDRMMSLGAVVALAMTLAGCATHPTTTVILMPDEDGHGGAVSVSSPAGTAQSSESFAASTVTGTRAPTAVNAMNRDAVTARNQSLLKAQPPKPVSFILYFHLDSTPLTDESKAQIPAVLAAVRERKPTEITIY